MAALTPKAALATLYRLREADIRVVIHPDTQQEPSLPRFCCASLVGKHKPR
jgi:hypothetical protein